MTKRTTQIIAKIIAKGGEMTQSIKNIPKFIMYTS